MYTIEEKTRWLGRYLECQDEIERLTEEIARLKALAEKVTVSFERVGSGKGGKGEDKIQTAVEQLEEMKKRLGLQMKQYCELRDEIDKAINQVDNQQYRRLLRLRFIDGCNWEDIAEKTGNSCRWVLEMRKKAISAIILKAGMS